jgi:RNA polymerase sigma factor (sigma-70 family)
MHVARQAIPPRPASPAAEAAAHLFQDHSGWIYGYCLRVLRSPEEAEDALQTTYLNACRSLNLGTRPRTGSAWLLRIAHNVCLARLRSSGRRDRLERTQDLGPLADRIPAPDRPRDDLLGLADALLGMPEQQRKAILLREWQGLSYGEVARELGVSKSAVETLIFRARRSLAARLENPKKPVRLGGLHAFDLGGLLAALKGVLAGVAGVHAVAAVTVVAATATVVAVDPAGVLHDPFAPAGAPPTAQIDERASTPQPVVATPATAFTESRDLHGDRYTSPALTPTMRARTSEAGAGAQLPLQSEGEAGPGVVEPGPAPPAGEEGKAGEQPANANEKGAGNGGNPEGGGKATAPGQARSAEPAQKEPKGPPVDTPGKPESVGEGPPSTASPKGLEEGSGKAAS